MSKESTAFQVLDDVGYIPGVNALVIDHNSSESFEDAKTPLNIGPYKIAKWGEENTLPYIVKDNVEKSEVLSTGLLFNTNVIYGQGVKPMRKVVKGGKVVDFIDCDDDDVNMFMEDNDISGFFLEQCTDMAWFHNVFPEIILSADKKKIVSLRHKEAMYSRWGVVEKGVGKLEKHYYCAVWNDSPTQDKIVESKVLDAYNPFLDLTERLKAREMGLPRYILPIRFPSPGKIYYPRASWWSIFNSGWYDYGQMLPEFKKARIKNGLTIRYLIYLSDKYWDIVMDEDGINMADKESVRKRKLEEYDRFKTFISDYKQTGKGMIATKKVIPSGSGAFEEKYIVIEAIQNDIKGGEFIEDSAEVSNIMSYALQVQPSMIGSSPGKNNNSFSGTDKRELFMIKSALMKPYRDRILKSLYFVKRFNGWDNDIVFVVPDMEFTTLDQNKSGKQEITSKNAD